MNNLMKIFRIFAFTAFIMPLLAACSNDNEPNIPTYSEEVNVAEEIGIALANSSYEGMYKFNVRYWLEKSPENGQVKFLSYDEVDGSSAPPKYIIFKKNAILYSSTFNYLDAWLTGPFSRIYHDKTGKNMVFLLSKPYEYDIITSELGKRQYWYNRVTDENGNEILKETGYNFYKLTTATSNELAIRSYEVRYLYDYLNPRDEYWYKSIQNTDESDDILIFNSKKDLMLYIEDYLRNEWGEEQFNEYKNDYNSSFFISE